MPITKRYTFQPRISAGLSSQLNTNFDEIINAYNSHTHTGIGTDAPVITNSGLAFNNQWAAFTPSWSNYTPGNGTNQGWFMKVGRTVFWRIKVVLGSSSSMGTAPTFVAPVAPATNYQTSLIDPPMLGMIFDTSPGTFYPAFSGFRSTTNIGFVLTNAGTTYGNLTDITASAPISWATGDNLHGSGFYEAAS